MTRILSLALITIWLRLASSRRQVSLLGAGASFPSEVYKSWIPSFKASRSEFVLLEMSYDSVGSGNGKKQIKGEQDVDSIQYAGSDSPLKEVDYENHTDLQMFPTMAGAVVLAYNLKGVDDLNLTREHMVGIYNGTYRWWNDSSFQALNPNAALPEQEIIVIARSDKSGTTEIFTSALSRFSSSWKSTYGTFSHGLDSNDHPVKWNNSVISYYGFTNRGVSGLILSLTGTVGYLSVPDARQAKHNYARLRNKANNLVLAESLTVQNAMEDYKDNFTKRFTATIVDAPGPQSYPIAGYTYFIVHMETNRNCDSAVELYRYVEWFLTQNEPKRDCELYNMVPVSDSIVQRVMDQALNRMKCKGKLIKDLVKEQKRLEEISKQSWRLPVYIGGSVVCMLVLALAGYLAWQQFKINKALIYEEWKLKDTELRMNTGDKRLFASCPQVANLLHTMSTSRLSFKGGQSLNGLQPMCLGRYKTNIVYLSEISQVKTQELKKKTKRLFLWMKDSVAHAHVVRFFGVRFDGNDLYLVHEFCSKGVLHDILQNGNFNFDDNFKFSLSLDVCMGMAYLHSIGIVHGNLTSACCYLDSKWNVKVSDWQIHGIVSTVKKGMTKYRDLNLRTIRTEHPFSNDVNVIARSMFWVAPELLRDPTALVTKECDVYSFAILLQEVFTREDPYAELTVDMEPIAVIDRLKTTGLRPLIPVDCSKALRSVIEDAWHDLPERRPAFPRIVKRLERAKPSTKSVLDCMMDALEDYVHHLEEKVMERTTELNTTMDRLESLLHKILPPSVASALSSGRTVEPESFDSVTIFFSDIVGFTSLCSISSPIEVVNFLNALYSVFDEILDKHDVYKVETIGDSYMVISGLPQRNGTAHAGHIATMALDLVAAADCFVIKHKPDRKLQLRIGIHSGPVVAGVVGLKMPRYCLFGDTVNTASRMESTSLPQRIQISGEALAILNTTDDFITTVRGDIEVKGKGQMCTYWLEGKRNYRSLIPNIVDEF